MDDSVIDVEVSEVIENVDIYKDEDLPENIDGLDGFDVHRFVERMIQFEDQYSLNEDSMILEVFDDEDGNIVWQVESETGTHNFTSYEEFEECLEKTPDKLINMK
jgi:hypothetical protein